MPQPEKPALDQHFMTDPELIRKIVSLAGIRKGETVLEIGAGKGTVTREIAKKAGRVIAVEIDPGLEKSLAGLKLPNAEIKTQNALDFLDGLDCRNPGFQRIVSNTPYSICEALVRRLIRFSFRKGVFAFPKSFAYRLIEKGEKRTRLSFVAQEFFRIEIKEEIPKAAFSPAPHTTSVLVVLTPRRKKSLAAALLLREKMLLKNALREVACGGFFGGKPTKREAKKRIKSLKINSLLLEKKVADLKEKEFKQVGTILKRIRF